MARIIFTVTVDTEMEIANDNHIHELTINVAKALESAARNYELLPEKDIDNIVKSVSAYNRVTDTDAVISLK